VCPEQCECSSSLMPSLRFILANTEQLHEKITILTDRVRDLEEALEAVQKKVSSHPHPLLKPDLLRIKTSEDLYGPNQGPHVHAASAPQPSALTQPMSQPPYRLIGASSPTAAETTLPQKGSSSSRQSSAGPPEVPKDVLQLSATFPFPWAVDLRIRQSIRAALPPQEEALAVCDQAQNNALWQ
jgi:hypothetical protein